MKAADEFFEFFEKELSKIAPAYTADFEKVIHKIRTTWQGESLYISPPSNDSAFQIVANDYIAMMYRFSSQLKMPVSKVAALLRKKGRAYKYTYEVHQEYKHFIRHAALKLQLGAVTTKTRLQSIQIPNASTVVSSKNTSQINLLN
jgi:hypothetical protein